MALSPRPLSEYRLGQMSGRVRCASTGQYLDSAQIVVEPSDPRDDIRWNVIPRGVSDSEGRFYFETAPVGSYDIWARRRGFVSRAAMVHRPMFIPRPDISFCAPREWLDANLQHVVVHEGTESNVEVLLHAGGSISGAVCWQDGSPARRNELCLMRLLEDVLRGRRSSGSYTDYLQRADCGWEDVYRTDEEGRFLLEDVVEGSYILGSRVPRLLSYVRPSEFSEQGMVNCFSSFYWSGSESNPARAISFQVTSGVETRVDLRLPMLEHSVNATVRDKPVRECGTQRNRFWE